MSRFNGYWVAAIALVCGTIAVSVALYPVMPDRIPVHWNFKGEVDGYGSRAVGLFLMPAVMAGMLVFFAFLPALSPRNFEVDTFKSSYLFVMLVCTGLFAYIHAVALYSAWRSVRGGAQVDTARVVIGGLFLFFGLLGNVMGKIRRNFYIGVRTPWTIASDRVWNDTHRLAAWLMVGGSLLGFVTLMMGFPVPVALVILLVATLFPVPYSFFHYKALERRGEV